MSDARATEHAPTDPDRARSRAAQQWLDDNRTSLEEWDAWVQEHGLPLAEFRLY